MAKKKVSMRIWILLAALLISLIAISPNPLAQGVIVNSVQPGSVADFEGITTGERILEVNRNKIENVADFNREIRTLEKDPINITVKTDKDIYDYSILQDIGFIADENLTILNSNDINLGERVLEINDRKINSTKEIDEIINDLFPKESLIILTDKSEYALLVSGNIGIKVEKAKKTNLVTGLDLQGGTRVLIQPVSDNEITDDQINDLVDILGNRLNVFGLSDVKIRKANDLEGTSFVLIEIAGASKEEVEELIGKQGVFQARIGDDVVFEGGEKDIIFVCRDDGSCSGIQQCGQISSSDYTCSFRFQISLSREAAKRHADITRDLAINISEQGGEYLEKPLDLYLDDELVDSLRIGADLRGQESTSISISGPGYGNNEEAALDDALRNMNQLQTVMITGSLPLDIEIVKLDSISPFLGQEFVKNIFLVVFLALISVAVVLLIRYRRIKVVIPILITSISEVFIILGVAALIKWNLDIVAIAGIIAAVGTGVDDQIIILDEILRGKKEYVNWKEKIKRAFFIIFAAYATTVAAMLPLIWAGAGLIRGFAVITIIGITVGVLITRPAFAAIAEMLFE